MQSPRQTLGYLRSLFEARGISPRSKLGQNFLIDLNLIDLVVKAAELAPDDAIVEVGSGTGSLTMRLVEKAAAVVSVEVDPAFAEMTHSLMETHFRIRESLTKPEGARREHVRLLHTDALENKNHLNPDLVQSTRELLAASGAKRLKLVANLPYAVAVPVMSNFLLTDLPIERMVAMVQWELAERMMAAPDTRDYGALAIMLQSLGTVELVRKVPPSAFFPRPEVDSAIVLFRADPAKREAVGDVTRLRHFLRDLYVHRRKNLRAALSCLPSGKIAKGEVDARLTKLGIDGTARAESLPVADHLRLAQEFGADSSEQA